MGRGSWPVDRVYLKTKKRYILAPSKSSFFHSVFILFDVAYLISVTVIINTASTKVE